MKSYLELLAHVLADGHARKDRTGVGTISVFGAQMRVDLQQGFPLLTTKKVHFKSIAIELLWFLRGGTNVKFLQEHGVTIWDEWADENGELGPVYGKQWRKWDLYQERSHIRDMTLHDPTLYCRKSLDQLENLVNDLQKNPFSRRHIVSAWNPVDVPKMKLPPCHTLWQCYVEDRVRISADNEQGRTVRFLHLHLYARSIDIFLGLPFNIASYALLLTLIAHVTGMIPGELIISFGDLHLYQNHIDQAHLQLSRTPKELPSLTVEALVPVRTPIETLSEFRYENFLLLNYDPHPAIKAPIAV